MCPWYPAHFLVHGEEGREGGREEGEEIRKCICSSEKCTSPRDEYIYIPKSKWPQRTRWRLQ